MFSFGSETPPPPLAPPSSPPSHPPTPFKIYTTKCCTVSGPMLLEGEKSGLKPEAVNTELADRVCEEVMEGWGVVLFRQTHKFPEIQIIWSKSCILRNIWTLQNAFRPLISYNFSNYSCIHISVIEKCKLCTKHSKCVFWSPHCIYIFPKLQ